MNIFVISSVRKAPQSLRDRLEAYSQKMVAEGHEVYLPHRDTDSSMSSLEIVSQNKSAIERADEIHLFYNPESQGSHFELGVAFALGKPIRVVENIDYPEGKSFARVVDEWQESGKVNGIPQLESKRLILRGIELTDAPSYQKYFVNYEVTKNLCDAVPWPYPENGVREYIENSLLPRQGKENWAWGIFLKEQPGELIGLVELRIPGTPENRGFWLGQPFWNRGIMTEACDLVNDFAFKHLNVEKLVFANAVAPSVRKLAA